MISEWYRTPISTLERTLRIPYLVKHSILLFLSRLLPIWVVWLFVLELVFQNWIVAILLGLLSTFFSEMFLIRNWLLFKVIPKHIQNLKTVINKYSRMKKLSPNHLCVEIESSVDLASWGLVNITYGAPPSWGWEIIFRIIYPTLVKDTSITPSDLLVGFKNKTIESDQFLWEIANDKNQSKQSSILKKYAELYGSRVDDADLSKPTLREQPKFIRTLISLYKGTKSPIERLKAMETKRLDLTNITIESLRVPKGLFLRFLHLVQDNVQLREDRRFYEFIMDYYLRQMILQLSKILRIDKNIIFNKSWNEIKNVQTN